MRRLLTWLGTGVSFVVIKAVPFLVAAQFRVIGVLVLVTGALFTVHLLKNMSTDTTAITNGAFVVIASLAALSFAACRSIPDPPDHQDRFRYAGERLLHGALFALYASILKYAAFALYSGLLWDPAPDIKAQGINVAGFLSSFSFGFATHATYGGVSALHRVLFLRVGRRRPFL